MNQQIQLQLSELESIEQEIREHLQQFMRKLANRVRFEQNEQYLTKQYEETLQISKGVFYDRTK
jgi:DNA topoisomerase VI subunit B